MALTKSKKKTTKKKEKKDKKETSHFSAVGNVKLSKNKTVSFSAASLTSDPSLAVSVTDEKFIPIKNFDGSATVVSASKDRVVFNPRTFNTVDCGFKLEHPPGYKIMINLLSKYAEKGLFAQVVDFDDGTKIVVHNAAKEIVVFEQGDAFAKIWLSPIQKFSMKVNIEGGE